VLDDYHDVDVDSRGNNVSNNNTSRGMESNTQLLSDKQQLAENQDLEFNLRYRMHSGERSASLGSTLEESKENGSNKVSSSSTNNLKKSWDVENKNDFDESNSEGGETWLTELLKHKISENLMEYDDDLDDDDDENELQQQTQQQQQLLLQQQKQQGVEGGSRYHKEFQEMHLLGKGGGGEVWKVKNNLDRRAYAVKKILLNPTDKASNNRIRREVTTISSLLHKHIVRYYAAWVEKLTIPVADDDDDDDDDDLETPGASREHGSDNTASERSLSDAEISEVLAGDSTGGKRKATTSTTIMNFR
jgi:hypothetical protein